MQLVNLKLLIWLIFNKNGAKITGHSSPVIVIEGVKKLHGANHTVIGDRIEAGTYMIAAAMTKGEVIIKNSCLAHLGVVIDKIKRSRGQC